jgi:hypothetical protein
MFNANITGRIGSFEYKKSDKYSVAKMRVATQKYKGKEQGDVNQWHMVVVWGKKADALHNLNQSLLDTQKQNNEKEKGLVGQYGACVASIEYQETPVTLKGKEINLPVAEFHSEKFDVLFTRFKENSCN